ncbi:hypothetical protein [Vibrio splendidus]|uniref:hypothetical protein n=1 Tax=Vibrio splendidus TaxID=29497 RepID=UPI000E32B67A|nr:hypothetical protein [Vibrio splendidus]
MKILYFDTFSLFYSHQYINSDINIALAYKYWRDNSQDCLLKVVKPDTVGIEKLRKAAVEAGFKLYPLGTRYTRTLFIEHELFTEDELAQDVPLNIRLGDNDPLRRMIAHSHKSSANWYVCGDIGPEMLEAFSGKHLTSTFGLGVTDELISKVRALKLA